MEIGQVKDLMVVSVFEASTAFAQTIGAISLAQGVPEPLMTDKINEALSSSLAAGWQYCDTRGLESLRQAIKAEYDNEFNLDEVLITSGCTESLYLGLYALNKLYGNKVAFFEPYYPYYPPLAKLLGMESISLPMIIKDGFMLANLDLVESVFKSGVKILILNTPHNPSGWVMSNNEAIYLRKLADKYGVFIVIDEAYRYYHYHEEDANLAIRALYEDNPNILLVGAASKLLSATGIRIGWLIARSEILELAYAIHLYTTYCHPAPLQEAVAKLLNNRDENWFDEIRSHYHNKKDILQVALTKIGFQCYRVSGGHFILADYSNIDNTLDSEQFARQFATKYKVMPLPVSAFYRTNIKPHQVRFSFSVAMHTIQQAIVLMDV